VAVGGGTERCRIPFNSGPQHASYYIPRLTSLRERRTPCFFTFTAHPR
jgi:hypothetical protein